jgi:hypothetical protein
MMVLIQNSLVMEQEINLSAPFNIHSEDKIFHVPILKKNNSVIKDIY